MKKVLGLMMAIALVASVSIIPAYEAKAQTATVPIMITVNGAITVTDAANDLMAGKDPSALNIAVTVTPDVEETDATATNSFRVRTNHTMWTLSATKTAFNAGTTNIPETSVGYEITKTAGSDADVAACAFQGVFTGATTLDMVTVASQTVCAGTAKIAMAASNSMNVNNYLQFDSTVTVPQDFFFEPGTATSQLDFTVTNP